MSERLASEKVVISSPLSFSGSAKRIWNITETDNPVLKIVLVIVALGLIGFVWTFVFFWYFLMYFVFGIFFFIYRLFRRSSRKNKADKLRHRELLNAIGKQNRK